MALELKATDHRYYCMRKLEAFIKNKEEFKHDTKQ